MVSYNKQQKTRGHEKSISLYQNKAKNGNHFPLSRERVLISGAGSGLESAQGFIQHSSLTEQKSQGVQKTRVQAIHSDIPSTSPNSQALITKTTRRSNNGLTGINGESPIEMHENMSSLMISDTRNNQNKQVTNTREDSQRRAQIGMDTMQQAGSFSNNSQSPLIIDNFSMFLHADPETNVQQAAFGSTFLFQGEGQGKDGKSIGQYLISQADVFSQDGTIGSPGDQERVVDKHRRNLSYNKGMQAKQSKIQPSQFSRYNH